MRIASLVPSSTEMLFALGLGDDVVGVTHECDHPEGAQELPHLTRSLIPEGLSASEIDAAVRERTTKGEAIYELDAELLRELAPELIVTQELCEVCAVSVDDVRAVAKDLPTEPELISLDPTTLGEVLADVPRLATAARASEAGEALIEESAARIDAVSAAVEDAQRPRVAALEWLDPVFIGGHWVPQLIDLAGGEDPLGLTGEKSRTASWDEVAAAQPEVVVAMPCGYGTQRSAQEAGEYGESIAALGAERVYAVDASGFFSRPGPRLIDGLELLAHLLHPDRVPAPPPGRMIQVA
ncbi:MAG: cobalamin-binding protein [Thermoleophilaceae bacterium]|nr:cobalamin-binding protein [Thermoleophilaceae bacterium]